VNNLHNKDCDCLEEGFDSSNTLQHKDQLRCAENFSNPLQLTVFNNASARENQLNAEEVKVCLFFFSVTSSSEDRSFSFAANALFYFFT